MRENRQWILKENEQTKLKNNNSFNWNRKRCLSCSNYTVSTLGKFCYKCDPRLNIKPQNLNILTKHCYFNEVLANKKLNVKYQEQYYPKENINIKMDQTTHIIPKKIYSK